MKHRLFALPSQVWPLDFAKVKIKLNQMGADSIKII